MAERPSIIPSVTVQLDRERHLRFDKRAYYDAEPLLTRLWQRPTTLLSVVQDLLTGLAQGNLAYLSLVNIAALLWLGLKHEAPDLTLEQVQEWVPYNDPAALLPLAAAIVDAWQVQTPQGQASAQEGSSDTDPLDGWTGSSSGALSAPASA